MNEKIKLTINDDDYYFIKDYKEMDKYRQSFNELTRKTYRFDFEQWYQQGYWQNQYIPYSLLYKDEIVSNVSVNTIDFLIDGVLHHTIQIGTVMTDKAFRNKGLSRALMDIVIKEYADKCDFIYLFANDNVLEFYPKFGFVEANEYHCSKHFQKEDKKEMPAFTCRKLNIKNDTDKAILTRLVSNTVPVSKISMVKNFGLNMFYCSSFMSDNIYYLEDLDIAIVAEIDENTILLQDVFSEKAFDLDILIHSIVTKENMDVVLGFTPYDSSLYAVKKLKEEDTTLFIRGKNLLGEAMFPILSRA